MRIALVAYGCEPERGTELGVGWIWAHEIAARGHEVVVYTHSDQKAQIDAHSVLKADRKLSFRYLKVRNWPLIASNRLAHQLHYLIWQWNIVELIRKDHAQTPYQVLHYVTWGGIRMPVFGWLTGVPYYVGPVGGGEEPPLGFCKSLGWTVFCKELMRKVLNRLCLIDPILRIGYNRADAVFVKTEESKQLLPRKARKRSFTSIEIGAKGDLVSLPLLERSEVGAPLRILFVARLLYWKSPMLAISVFKELLRRGVPVELTMIGTGPELPRVMDATADLPPGAKFTHIHNLPQPRLFELMRTQDCLLFPSLHDSSGNVVLEAMALGLPVLALALGGPREILSQGGGVLIPTDGRTMTEVVHHFADTLERYSADCEAIEDARKFGKARAADMSWADAVSNVYKKIERQQQLSVYSRE